MTYHHILFDWGNTLMLDDSNQDGPMCDWEEVEAVPGARKVLSALSGQFSCHLATNANDSSQFEIRHALDRVGLGQYITQIFCSNELGHAKPSRQFYEQVLNILKCPPQDVLMIGDHLENDVLGALNANLDAIWLAPTTSPVPKGIKRVKTLHELLGLLL